MVVKMMKWKLSTKKFEAKIVIKCLKGLSLGFQDLGVEISWKGSSAKMGLSPLSLMRMRRRSSVKRDFTREGCLIRDDGVVQWNEGEEFRCDCNFSCHKDDGFLPWDVSFALINSVSKGPANKLPPIATGSLNLAEFASIAQEKDVEISVPLEVPGCCSSTSPLLCLSLSLVELGNDHEAVGTMQKTEVSSKDRNDASPLRAGLGKVGFFKALSVRGRKKAYGSEEGSSSRSEETEYTDSLSDSESEEGKGRGNIRKTVSYETIACANHARGSFYLNSNCENDDLIYYSHQRSDVGCVYLEDGTGSVFDQSIQRSSKRSRIMPWRKKKLSSKSKGEPLLKKHYGEEGGDDIDFVRRQLSSSDESSYGWRTEGSTTSRSSVSEFGDDNFAVGSWEVKEIVSRDGKMKLQSQVFFASIDQRNERAAGESACTALVVAIADWFHSNQGEMPIKSELDSLIHEGALEWRKLCENESYRERFPDKHFDLETVLEAKAGPLSVSPEKSFIGFFHPEGVEGECFDFLKEAMSFDDIWDEVSGQESVYIVSWNDHFFVLKVERDAYYIIDTLGERLFEGCNQAFMLRFDRDTMISLVPEDTPVTAPKKDKESVTRSSDGETEKNDRESVLLIGKEACKEYIKSFLAAIPIRELQIDLKKRSEGSTLPHQRLQIEFHHTDYQVPSSIEAEQFTISS